MCVCSGITPPSPACITAESGVQPWGKLNFYCPNLLFTLLPSSLLSWNSFHTQILLFLSVPRLSAAFRRSCFGPHQHSPAVSPGCTHQTGSKMLFRRAGLALFAPSRVKSAGKSNAERAPSAGARPRLSPGARLPLESWRAAPAAC